MIYVNDITIVPSCKEMTVGESAFLRANVLPENATKKSVCWSSSNPAIVTVNPNTGLIMAQDAGSAYIYATACDGSGCVGCCCVTVEAPILVTDITVCPETLNMTVGETVGLCATVSPANANNKSIRWSSCNTSIATVDSISGCVEAISEGSTCVYANAIDGSDVFGCCSVTVNSNTTEEETIIVPALRTIKACYVRTDTNTGDSTLILNSSGDGICLSETQHDVVRLLNENTITGGTYDGGRNDWYQILYDGMMCYVTADSFEVTTMEVSNQSPSGENIRVDTGDGSNLNVRRTPNTNHGYIGKFPDGSTVILTNDTPQNGNWYAVYGTMQRENDPNDTFTSYGWCHGDYLCAVEDNIMEYHIISQSGNGNALYVGDSTKNIFNLYPDTIDKNIYIKELTYMNRCKFKFSGTGSKVKIHTCLNEEYMLCKNDQNGVSVYGTTNSTRPSEISTDFNSDLTVSKTGNSDDLVTIKLSNSNLYLTSSNGNVNWDFYDSDDPSNQIWKLQKKPENIHNGLDTATQLTEAQINLIVRGGEEFVVRYYSRVVDSWKRLLPSEVTALHNQGIKIVSVYQHSGNDVSCFSSENATEDARAALNMARDIGQPSGAAIYFAVDYDAGDDLDTIANYFYIIKNIIGSEYKIGVYGCGAVCQRIKQELGYAEYSWLSQSVGHSDYASYDNIAKYNIKQAEERILYGISCDDDVSVGTNYGQW